ncbi:MAG: T9SS type A sorting domain-containing protein [Candidatus Krumholzibacteria bacterium]|nr:T9SS type A sorting domain-containing protein [Candidatus Krumholzibacteria bacterium]MDH4335759.1 T9SS type A sorting domain-containing protein [Candidatus Krumholzibacteria bacterium]MDH5269285.1 T9SS type A sorting domain-containing protein [Candidatus Krumholzibacteria bacterium]
MLTTFIATGALALAASTPIADIQGRAHVSPFRGEDVTTRGIVTTVVHNGFYLQDPTGDGDNATADGVFTYTGTAPGVSSGDEVEVAGTVVEFLPGGDPENLSITEIHPSSVRILARQRPLPIAVVIGGSGRIPPGDIMDDDALTIFEPSHDGIDFWESLEGMRVRLVAPRVVGPTNAFGEVWVAVDNGFSGMSAGGALTATLRDANPERVQIDDALLPAPMPAFDTGDVMADVVGVVDYRFGCYEVLPGASPAAVSAAPAPASVSLPGGRERLSIASFNVRNLSPADTDRVPRLAEIVVRSLGAPAILVMQEIQDSSGPVDDGTAGATATLDTLAAAIRRAGGPTYAAREVAPADGADGGVPGGNIRVAVLFDSTRISFVDRGAADANTGTSAVPAGDSVMLTLSPGRVDPANAAWEAARKPLAAEFRVGAVPLFLVACHFSSRSGTTPEFGSVQPPFDPRSGKRFAQAEIVRDFVQSILRLDPDARVIVAGDFNDDVFSGALAPLSSSTALFDLHWRLSEEERYSYVYEGNAHAYDRILVSPALVAGAAVDIVHVCSGSANAASDHDPVVASVVPLRTPPGGAGGGIIRSVFPNPSRGVTTIVLSGRSPAMITIHDARGRRVRRLSPPGANANQFLWDGKDDTGRPVAPGVYFVRVLSADGAAARRIVRMHARE